MTTTELIKLLQGVERGASGRARDISFVLSDIFISEPKVTIVSTGDGCAGAMLCLKIEAEIILI